MKYTVEVALLLEDHRRITVLHEVEAGNEKAARAQAITELAKQLSTAKYRNVVMLGGVLSVWEDGRETAGER